VGNTAFIKVSVDETVGHYDEWLAKPLWRIRQMNRFGNNSAIRIGERLTIPADPATLDRFIQARLEYHLAVEEDFYSQFKVAEVKPHTVVRGENIWTMCNNAEGEIPQWLLKKYNRQVDLSALMPGAVVWIPVIAEKTADDYKEEGFTPAGGYPYYIQPLVPPSKPVQRVP
jgi:membrane-bound lytic murein transglycosylase D